MAGIILAYIVLAVFGLGNGWVFAGGLLLALGAAVWEGVRLRAPTGPEIDRRIEAASGLRHRPLAALADVPVGDDAMGAAIWRAHQARVTAELAQARTGWPMPFAAGRDRFSVRALLLLLLASGVVIAGADAPARLGAAFTLPPWPFAGPTINAWMTPPGYTGQGPGLLVPGVPVTVLAGSRLSVLVDGSADAVHFREDKLASVRLGRESRRVDAVMTASGVLSVGPWWHRLAQWDVTVVPPEAPVLALDAVAPDAAGLKLSWNVGDPYGLASLAVAIRPLGYPDALPEGAALPDRLGKTAARLDTRDSPYGGIGTALTLRAVNLAGVTAVSAPQDVTLPAMAEHDPTALVLSIIRQNLALTPGQAPAIARQMMHVAQAPPSPISFAADAQLAMLAAALRTHGTDAQGAVTKLLALIKEIEAGPDFAPAKALAQASRALLQALAHGPPDAATLAKLLAAVRQALAQHLAAGQAGQPGQPGQNFDPSSLDKMAAQIAADEQAGRTQQAQAEMQQLAAALHALQNARPMSAAEAAQAQAAGRAAKALSQLIKNQAGLLDQTIQGNATPPQQAQLQTGLQQLGQSLGKAGMPNLPGLGPAGQAMQDATAALGQQNTGAAQAAETGAIQNMQKAAAALQKSMARSFSVGPGDDEPGLDPSGDSPDGANDDMSNPGLNLQGDHPADAIEREIIRLDADPALPAATHDYLHRLLSPDQ